MMGLFDDYNKQDNENRVALQKKLEAVFEKIKDEDIIDRLSQINEDLMIRPTTKVSNNIVKMEESINQSLSKIRGKVNKDDAESILDICEEMMSQRDIILNNPKYTEVFDITKTWNLQFMYLITQKDLREILEKMDNLNPNDFKYEKNAIEVRRLKQNCKDLKKAILTNFLTNNLVKESEHFDELIANENATLSELRLLIKKTEDKEAQYRATEREKQYILNEHNNKRDDD